MEVTCSVPRILATVNCITILECHLLNTDKYLVSGEHILRFHSHFSKICNMY